MFANNSVGANYTYLPIEHYDIGKLKGKGNTKPLSVFFTPTCFSAPWKLQKKWNKSTLCCFTPTYFLCTLRLWFGYLQFKKYDITMKLKFLWSCIQLFINIFTVGLWCLGIPKKNYGCLIIGFHVTLIRQFKKFGRNLNLNVAFWWQNLLLDGPGWLPYLLLKSRFDFLDNFECLTSSTYLTIFSKTFLGIPWHYEPTVI